MSALPDLSWLAADPAALDEALLDLERLRLEDSLFAFYAAAWPQYDPLPLKLNWHHEAIAEHCEAVVRGEILNLLVNIPPRCSKTSLITVSLPAWIWARRWRAFLSGPQVRFLCVSYGTRPAERQARTARQLILGEWYRRRWGESVQVVNEALEEFSNAAGGYRISASLSGAILGAGADLVIVDDPHNLEEAESAVEAENTRRGFSEGLTTRRTDPTRTARILVMQRLTERDCSAEMLEKFPDSVHLMLPMEFDPQRWCRTAWYEDPRREAGELLWPQQFPAERVAADKFTLGDFAYAGQYDQSPQPRGGGIIKRDWWQVWPDYPLDLSGLIYQDARGEWQIRAMPLPDVSYVVMAIDTNMTARDEGDWNACTVWGVWHRRAQPYALDDEMVERWAALMGRPAPRYRHEEAEEQPRVILMEAWRMRGPLRTGDGKMGLVERILDTARRRHADRLLIENTARGQDVHDEILRGVRPGEFMVQLWDPKKHGDKVARLTSTQPLFQQGLVYTPVTFDPRTGAQREFQWVEMVVDEVSAVPRGAHDDLADTASCGLIWLRENGMLQLTEEHKRELIESRTFTGRRESVRERYGL